MLLKAKFKNLKSYQKEYLEQDILFGKAQVKKEVFEALDKIKNDKNLSLKLVRAINKANPFGSMFDSIDDLVSVPLETMINMDIIKIREPIHKGVETYVLMEVADMFFDLMKQATFKMSGILGLGKKGFIRKTEKGFKKDYGKKFISIEVNPPGVMLEDNI